MLRLTTLGAIRFSGPGDAVAPHPILSQPKRLALLAYLALARPGSLVFRDSLVALLWPDYGTLQARRALRQTLHHLRHELGPELILGSNAESVGLDPERFWCDALELERAFHQDRLDTVLELYGGEFLPGFHPQCGTEFERWLDEARERLRRRATAAAATLVERAEKSGEVRRAVEHARRLVELLPYDEQAARTLIRLLARSGNRTGALETYHALAARLRGQLELAPDSHTQALFEAVRAGEREPPVAAAERSTAGSAILPLPRLPGAHSLAVLPFATLTGTLPERVLGEGLGEMLITELTRRGTLTVVSRTSVQSCRGASQSLAAVARSLGVELVVEGTVLECGSRLRITVQLLVASPERHLWADSFERDGADPFAVQAELAATIADGIEAALASPDGEYAPAIGAAAREAYFRARCHFARMSPSGFTDALRLLQEAIRLDPRYARAHASLAFTLSAMARMGRIAPRTAFADARRRAERALALDPRLPEAHVVMGTCALFLDHQWEQAEAHMRRGLELGANLPDSWWAYSNLLLVTGRFDEARRAARRARELDPVMPTLWLNEVLVLVGSDALEEADRSATEFAAFHRANTATAFALGMVCEAQHEAAQAVVHFRHALELGGGPHTVAALAHNLAATGCDEQAQQLLAQLLAAAQDRYVPPTAIARIHAALGDADEAFRWLDRATAERDDWLLFLDAWPRFEPIRHDLRFTALRRELELPGTAFVMA